MTNVKSVFLKKSKDVFKTTKVGLTFKEVNHKNISSIGRNHAKTQSRFTKTALGKAKLRLLFIYVSQLLLILALFVLNVNFVHKTGVFCKLLSTLATKNET